MTEKPAPPPWSLEEDNRLRELILGANSVEAIARLLNRTPIAVRRRANKLKISLRRVGGLRAKK
jgi:hypothetical protein